MSNSVLSEEKKLTCVPRSNWLTWSEDILEIVRFHCPFVIEYLVTGKKIWHDENNPDLVVALKSFGFEIQEDGELSNASKTKLHEYRNSYFGDMQRVVTIITMNMKSDVKTKMSAISRYTNALKSINLYDMWTELSNTLQYITTSTAAQSCNSMAIASHVLQLFSKSQGQDDFSVHVAHWNNQIAMIKNMGYKIDTKERKSDFGFAFLNTLSDVALRSLIINAEMEGKINAETFDFITAVEVANKYLSNLEQSRRLIASNASSVSVNNVESTTNVTGNGKKIGKSGKKKTKNETKNTESNNTNTKKKPNNKDAKQKLVWCLKCKAKCNHRIADCPNATAEEKAAVAVFYDMKNGNKA